MYSSQLLLHDKADEVVLDAGVEVDVVDDGGTSVTTVIVDVVTLPNIVLVVNMAVTGITGYY